MWHGGHHALITPVQTPDGKVGFLAFPIQLLRMVGWKVNPEDMRRSLPRFDEGPKLATSASDQDIRAAAASATRNRAGELKIRHG